MNLNAKREQEIARGKQNLAKDLNRLFLPKEDIETTSDT